MSHSALPQAHAMPFTPTHCVLAPSVALEPIWSGFILLASRPRNTLSQGLEKIQAASWV